MSVIVPVLLSVVVGWLATLTLQSHGDDVAVVDFTIAIVGAGLAAVAAPSLGISITGAYGVTLSGIGLMYAGAIVILSAANLVRTRSLRRPPRATLRVGASREAVGFQPEAAAPDAQGG